MKGAQVVPHCSGISPQSCASVTQCQYGKQSTRHTDGTLAHAASAVGVLQYSQSTHDS